MVVAPRSEHVELRPDQGQTGEGRKHFLLFARGSIAARHRVSTSQILTVDPKAEQRCL
jgi:hypothetical protein